MKFNSPLLICLFLLTYNYVLSQDQKFTGQIIDQNTNEPVFGTVLQYSGKVISFSDNTGHFQFLLTNPSLDDSLTIIHLAYKVKSVSLEDIKSGKNLIPIEQKLFSIDEVVVKPINVVKLLKQIKNQFRENYPRLCNWAEVNYTQLISYRGEPCGYLECNGNMLLMGAKEKNPFVKSFIIPSQLRRTNEKPELTYIVLNSSDVAQRVQVSGLYMNSLLTEYRFFEVCHPLNSHIDNNFDFQLDSVTRINNISCYLFSFTQKSKIGCVGWNIYGMKGQMWIDINNYNLVKIISVLNRGDVASSQFEIEYQNVNNVLYPLNISINYIHNKYLTKLLSQKIYIESQLNFGKIDITERDYARKYNYEIESYLPYFKYDKDFWIHQPISNSHLRSNLFKLIDKNTLDSKFEEGSYEKIFTDSKIFDSVFKKSSDAIIEVMKRDLKIN